MNMNIQQIIGLCAEARKDIALYTVLSDPSSDHPKFAATLHVLREALLTHRFHATDETFAVLANAQEELDALVFDVACGSWELQP